MRQKDGTFQCNRHVKSGFNCARRKSDSLKKIVIESVIAYSFEKLRSLAVRLILVC